MDILHNNNLFLNTIDSTNNYLKNNHQLWSKPYFTVYTTNQTHGKGQQSNKWYGKKNQDLALSFVYLPQVIKHSIPDITLIVAEGVSNALQKILSRKVRIKFPNDILYDNKKLCGILCEYITEHIIIIGIGININNTKFPKWITQEATSLKLITQQHYDIVNVLKEVIFEVYIALEQNSL